MQRVICDGCERKVPWRTTWVVDGKRYCKRCLIRQRVEARK